MADTINSGDVLKFDGKRSCWLVRAITCDGRYILATSKVSNRVYYTILDTEKLMRGPLNIIGNGMGIFTTSGPDAQIDETIRMLEDKNDCWEVSRRNSVPLIITGHRKAVAHVI